MELFLGSSSECKVEKFLQSGLGWWRASKESVSSTVYGGFVINISSSCFTRLLTKQRQETEEVVWKVSLLLVVELLHTNWERLVVWCREVMLGQIIGVQEWSPHYCRKIMIKFFISLRKLWEILHIKFFKVNWLVPS